MSTITHPRSLEERRQHFMLWAMLLLSALVLAFSCYLFGSYVMYRAEAWQCIRADYAPVAIGTDPPRLEAGVGCSEWVNVHTGAIKRLPPRKIS